MPAAHRTLKRPVKGILHGDGFPTRLAYGQSTFES